MTAAAACRAQLVAVLIPCCNEAVAIGKVVADFRAAPPDATIPFVDVMARYGHGPAPRAQG